MDNQRYLWGILEDVSKNTADRTATQVLIGDYFAACMDLEGIDARGIDPLKEELDAIRSVEDKAQLGALIAWLIARTDSRGFFFAIGGQQDARESDKVIGAIYAGGLGLPARRMGEERPPGGEARPDPRLRRHATFGPGHRSGARARVDLDR